MSRSGPEGSGPTDLGLSADWRKARRLGRSRTPNPRQPHLLGLGDRYSWTWPLEQRSEGDERTFGYEIEGRHPRMTRRIRRTEKVLSLMVD